MSDNFFKKCTVCNKVWKTRESLLEDDEVFLVGYQANKSQPERGLFLFNHLGKGGCGTTFSIFVEKFIDMYEIESFEKDFSGTEECLGFCLKIDSFDRCDNPCRFASIRELMCRLIEDYSLIANPT